MRISGLLRIVIFYCLLSLLLSCGKKSDYRTHESGLQYMYLVHDDKSTRPKPGDVLVLKLIYKTEDGEVIFNSKEVNGTFRMQLTKPSHPGGSFEDGLSLMNLGDSIRFLVDAQSFFEMTKKQTFPPNIKIGSKLIFEVRLMGIQTYSDVEQERMASYHISFNDEMNLLRDYVKKANITVKPLKSGLYYIESKAGKGNKAEKGEKVTLHYTGSFIDGRIFYSSLERNSPFTFILGTDKVIPGLEEGLSQMHEGGKATLIIPSDLAYGDKQTNVSFGDKQIVSVAPFSTIIFEIELINAE